MLDHNLISSLGLTLPARPVIPRVARKHGPRAVCVLGVAAALANFPAQAQFGPQQAVTTTVFNPTSVYATDLDGDGDADVLSASWYRIAWYEN